MSEATTKKRAETVKLADFVTAVITSVKEGEGTFEEVAEKTGLSVNSVKTRYSGYRKPTFEKDDDGNVVNDESGNPVIKQHALPLPALKSRGTTRSTMNDVLSLIADLTGTNVEQIKADQAKADQSAVKALAEKATEKSDS